MSPAEQLEGFIAKFTPDVAAQTRAALAKMRQKLPGAIELVYDNYNALAIAFGPTEKTSEAIFSIAVYPRWVSLFFVEGAGLPDPDHLLQGNGKIFRFIVLKDVKILDSRPVKTLMSTALGRADKQIDAKQPNRVVIKSISGKQRPRRPA